VTKLHGNIRYEHDAVLERHRINSVFVVGLIVGLGEEPSMKTFLVACAAAVVIAIVSVMVLNAVPDSAEKAFSSATSVRLGA
jgi:hypothetical protein